MRLLASFMLGGLQRGITLVLAHYHLQNQPGLAERSLIKGHRIARKVARS